MKPIPVVFHLWKIQIHTYGIGLAVTFWFAYRYFERRVRKVGLDTGWLTALFLWVIAAAIVGARVVHVAANWTGGADYSQHLGDVVRIWNGGLSSFGGLLFAVPTGILIARRRCPQLGTWQALDLVAPVLMAAWAIGRLLGPQLMYGGGGHPTSQWFGMYYAGEVGKRLPVPLFQAFDSAVIWGALVLLERRRPARPVGLVLSATVALWGLARFFEELLWLRDAQSDSRLGEHLVEATGLAMFALGLGAMALLTRRAAKVAVAPSEHAASDSSIPSISTREPDAPDPDRAPPQAVSAALRPDPGGPA